MAGLVYFPDARGWTTGGSTFYWMIDRLAVDASESLAAHLREISDNYLGSLEVEDLDADQLAELARLLRSLGEVARRELPDTPGREPIAQQAEELSAMFDAQPPGVPGEPDGAHRGDRRSLDGPRQR